MLLGRHPLAAIWFYCRDVERSLVFYRDMLGLPVIDEHSGTAHLDGGGVRLSLHPEEPDQLPPRGSFVVFPVVDGIEAACVELVRRGVEFSAPLQREAIGRMAALHDPDGHTLFLWEPPSPGDSGEAMVGPLIRHFESLASRLGA